MRAADADYGRDLQRTNDAYGHSASGSAHTNDDLTVEIGNSDTLLIGHPEGFTLHLPRHRITTFEFEDRGQTGELLLRIEATPADRDNTLTFCAVLPCRGDPARQREELERFRERVYKAPESARPKTDSASPSAEAPRSVTERPAAERPGPSRAAARPPSGPIHGPALTADPKNTDWLILQPLADTMALSRGKLLVPEEPPDR